MIVSGFVLNPTKELSPDYKISPFRATELVSNKNLPESDLCDSYFKERFHDQEYIYTQSGREAINHALAHYSLKKNDCVTILTTTGNIYISRCVTDEIEKFCSWSRIFEKNTKIILVNHEFGYPFKNLLQLRDFNLPIIEDCAYSFFSKDKDCAIGTVGNFVIYSFPKIFPIQIGGLLLSNFPNSLKMNNQICNETLRYVKNVLSFYLSSRNDLIQKRISNYRFLKSKFKSLGFAERFPLDLHIVPGVFMFRTKGQKIDLPELKKYYYAHGVQCSVFYGEKAFYIPVNQSLNEQDMLYFYEVIKSFLNQND